MATSPQQMQGQQSQRRQGGNFSFGGRRRAMPWQQGGQFGGGMPQFDPSQMKQQFQQLRPQGGQSQEILGGGMPQMNFREGPASDFGMSPQGQRPSQGQQTLAPGAALTRESLQPYLGKGGNVAINPYTGQPIAQEDKVKPGQYMRQDLNNQSRELLNGPAIQEAQNFQFNVPDSGVQGLLPQMSGAASGLLSGGQNALQAGQGLTQGGAQALLGNIGQTGQVAQQSGQERSQALAQLQDLQQRALSPNIDPAQRQMLQAMADETRANINTRFAEGGDVANQFNRQNAADVAQLAARGVLDSQTGANVIGRRQADLGALQANLLSQADQQANQRIIDEQNRITQAAGAFGGIQGGQATGAGGLLSNLLGTQGQSASQLGGLGTAQQGIGAQLSGLGLQGLNQAGQLGLADQGQQADMQQAALSTRMMGNQLGLQNIQSFLNQQLGRQATKQQMDYFTQLMQQMNPQESFGFMNFLSPISAAFDQKSNGG